jgi:Flp pilus assembly pilin Flp
MALATFVSSYLQVLLTAFHRDERAQDVFEYLLVIGGVSVVVVLAIVSGVGDTLINGVIDGVCTAIKGVVSSVDCGS